MKKTKVIMLLSNPYRPDNRVHREALSLQQLDYQVKIIAWDRQAELPASQEDEGISIERIHNIRSVYYGGMRQALVMPLFWNAARSLAERETPDIVHCHDLDTLYAGVQVKRRTGCSLVFDAHELYPAMMSLYLPIFFVHWLQRLEKQLMRHADLVLTASQVLGKLYQAKVNRPVEVILNTSELEAYTSISDIKIQQKRFELGIREGELCVAYIGGFTRNRLILPLIEAVKGLENVRLLVWGDGIQRSDIERAVQDNFQVQYLGWLPPEDIPICTKAVDVIYYALQPDYPGALYNAPNALGYAMAAGKPIIANRIGDLGNIVETENCGVLLEEVTISSIRSAIQLLQKDEQIRLNLGHNGQTAAKREYHWGISAMRLQEAYAKLSLQTIS